MTVRLDKINSLVCKSPPLKTWSSRGAGEVKSRLDVELTARRTLSYLSGGDLIPLLREQNDLVNSINSINLIFKA